MLTALLIVSLLQPPAAAIRGQVVDARTLVPLAGVHVALEGTGASTQTDREGRFEIPTAPGVRRLFVSLVGYALVRREVNVPGEGVDLRIPLAEGTGTYTEAVTVAADRFLPAEHAVPSQQVLGSADLQNLRGVLADDPLRAVQALPGVVAGDDLRSEFTVRASPFAHINLTVDGFATPYILHTVRAIEDVATSGSVAMINSDILQDVSLLSGAYPQRFGNRTGAQVDFRLREGSRERPQARFAVSGTNAAAVVEGPLGAKRGAWLVSARQSYLDLIIRQIQQGVEFGFSDAQSKVAYDVSARQRLELTLIVGRSALREDHPDTESTDQFVARNRSVILTAGWRLAGRRGTLAARSLGAFNDFNNTAEDGVRLDDGHDKQLASRVDGALAISRAVTLEGGADIDWTSQRRSRQRAVGPQYRSINAFDASAVKTGGYAQLRLSAGRVSLVPGVRADHWTLTGETTQSPWAQAQMNLPASLVFRAGAGVYQQFPAFEQVVGAFAAPSPRRQRAVQADAGLEQRFGESVRWQVTFYSREESSFFRRPTAEARIVAGRFVAGSRTARFTQTVKGYARGIELMLQRRSATGLSGWLSYAYGRNRYEDRESGESYWGDFDQRHTMNLYGFFRKSDRVSFSAKARIGTNVPATGYYREADGLMFVSSVRNEVRMPLYSRVDLRANRTFNWSRSRLTLFAEVLNVLNRDNVRFNPPGIDRRTLQVHNMFEQIVPLLPSVGVLFEF